MYSVPLYKSCQLFPWGPYWPRPGGVMGKILNFFFSEKRPKAFIFCFYQCIVVLFINFFNCAPGVHTGPAHGASWEKHKKKIFFSETIWPGAFICCVDQCIILSFINSCQRCPWGPYRPLPRHVIIYHRLIMEIYEKIFSATA